MLTRWPGARTIGDAPAKPGVLALQDALRCEAKLELWDTDTLHGWPQVCENRLLDGLVVLADAMWIKKVGVGLL